MDAFFYDVLNTQKIYEDLWTALKFLLTLSHGQSGCCRRKFLSEQRSPCTKSQRRKLESSLFCLWQSFSRTDEIPEFVISDELLTSCSHANNRYKMYLMGTDKEAQQPEMARKRKALQEELTAANKQKRELEVIAQKVA